MICFSLNSETRSCEIINLSLCSGASIWLDAHTSIVNDIIWVIFVRYRFFFLFCMTCFIVSEQESSSLSLLYPNDKWYEWVWRLPLFSCQLMISVTAFQDTFKGAWHPVCKSVFIDRIPGSQMLDIYKRQSPSYHVVFEWEVSSIFIISIIRITIFIIQGWPYVERTAPLVCWPIALPYITTGVTHVTWAA